MNLRHLTPDDRRIALATVGLLLTFAFITGYFVATVTVGPYSIVDTEFRVPPAGAGSGLDLPLDTTQAPPVPAPIPGGGR